MQGFLLMLILGAVIFMGLSIVMFFATRYKRCPSDKILVIYGKVAEGQSAKCIHGGGAMVMPLIQDCAFLSLTPMTISINLQNALSKQNIRISVPSTFTVGISTDPYIMTVAAERLLGLNSGQIESMAREIIFGQLRLTVASLTIEEINQNRERFLTEIRANVEPELNKIGLYLINVNITDIADESEYIESIGKKAASEAVNRAKVDVAEQDKMGAMGQSDANREKEIKVAEFTAESIKGQKRAEADKRIYLQQQEAEAIAGEAAAMKEQQIQVAINQAESDKGQKQAEADRRIFIQNQEAQAVLGENQSKAKIADANAELALRQAVAQQKGQVAELDAKAEIQKAQYRAEQERLNAAEVVRQEIDKRKVEIAAEAEAERIRREARGQADAVLLRYTAEARGVRQVLESKAAGYAALVQSCGGDAKAAATFLMTEKIEEIVGKQVEAIKNLKIDKITVWDSGTGGNSSTANFVSSLVKSLPPLQDIAEMAGVELPAYLGNLTREDGEVPIKVPPFKEIATGLRPQPAITEDHDAQG